MSYPHEPGDPISYYPTQSLAWLRNERDRAQEAVHHHDAIITKATNVMRQAQRDRDRAKNAYERERENIRRAKCDLEKRFATRVEAEEEATQAGLYQA